MDKTTPWRGARANELPCSADCTKRCVGCHSSCKEYIEAKKERDEKNAAIRAKRIAEKSVNDYVSKRISETTKKPRKSR